MDVDYKYHESGDAR